MAELKPVKNSKVDNALQIRNKRKNRTNVELNTNSRTKTSTAKKEVYGPQPNGQTYVNAFGTNLDKLYNMSKTINDGNWHSAEEMAEYNRLIDVARSYGQSAYDYIIENNKVDFGTYKKTGKKYDEQTQKVLDLLSGEISNVDNERNVYKENSEYFKNYKSADEFNTYTNYYKKSYSEIKNRITEIDNTKGGTEEEKKKRAQEKKYLNNIIASRQFSDSQFASDVIADNKSRIVEIENELEPFDNYQNAIKEIEKIPIMNPMSTSVRKVAGANYYVTDNGTAFYRSANDKQKDITALRNELKNKMDEAGKTQDEIDALEKEKITLESTNKSLKTNSEAVDKETKAKNSKDFEEKSGYVSTKAEGFFDKLSSDGLGYNDSTYEYINNVNGYRDKYLRYHRTAGTGDSVFEKNGYDYINEEEVSVYNYYYATKGAEAAEKYLDSIAQRLRARKASKDYKEVKGDKVREFAYGFSAGFDSFSEGLKNVFNFSDEYIPPTATQMTSDLIKEELGKEGAKLPDWLGGSSVSETVYDFFYTAGNMVPSILTSTAVGMVNPTAGAALGAGLMGASAAGNAYAQALNSGMDKGQARVYSTFVGASEAGLQAILGGIGKLGGSKSVSSFLKTTVGKVENGLLSFALNFGGSVIAEGTEEGLQEILNPMFENIAYGANINGWEDIEWGEVAYSALLGGMMGGVFEGPGAVIDSYKKASSKHKAVKILKLGVEGSVISTAESLDIDTSSYAKEMSKLQEYADMLEMGEIKNSEYKKQFNKVASEIVKLNNEITEAGGKVELPANTKKSGIAKLFDKGFFKKTNADTQEEQTGADVYSNDGNEFDTEIGLQSEKFLGSDETVDINTDNDFDAQIRAQVDMVETTRAIESEMRKRGTNNTERAVNVLEQSREERAIADRVVEATTYTDKYGKMQVRAKDARGVLPKNYTAEERAIESFFTKRGINMTVFESESDVDGFKNGNTVYLNRKTAKKYVFKHEFSHFVEKAEEDYKKFGKSIEKAVASSKTLRAWVEKKASRLKGYDKNATLGEKIDLIKTHYGEQRGGTTSNTEQDFEFYADFVMDNLYNGTDIDSTIAELENAFEDKTTWQKFCDFMRRLIKHIKELGLFDGVKITKLESQFAKVVRSEKTVANDNKTVYKKATQKTSVSDVDNNRARFIKEYGKDAVETLNDLAIKLNNNIDVPKSKLLNHPIVQDAIQRVKSINGGKETYLDNSAERMAIRERVKNKLLALGSFTRVDKDGVEVYNSRVDQDKIIDIVIGLPGAGKSSVIVNPLSQKHSARVIDSDMAKAQLPEYDNGYGASAVHIESQDIANKVIEQSVANGDNIVYPIVGGGNVQKLLKKIEYFKAFGYTVNLHLNEVPSNVSLGRTIFRFINDGRFIHPDIVTKYGDTPTENYKAIREMEGVINEYSWYSNDVERGHPAKEIERFEQDRYFGRRNGLGKNETNNTKVNSTEKQTETGLDDKSVFSFGGENARSADKSRLEKAIEMEQDGVDSETIRKETGWFRGYEKKWKFEIDDSKLTFYDFDPEPKGLPLTLGAVIKHKPLFEAYPELKLERVVFKDDIGVNGEYIHAQHTIVLNKERLNDFNQLKKTLVHEIQHAIQFKEGFTVGASENLWKNQRNIEAPGYKARKQERINKMKDIENRIETEFGKQAVEESRELIEISFVENDLSYEEFQKRCHEIEARAEKYGYKALQDELYDLRDSVDLYWNENAYELYESTAGEIESRDVSNRVDFIDEQRKATRPDVDRDFVVFSDEFFSESGDTSFSISDDNSYSYDSLISKPDMEITLIDDEATYEPTRVVRKEIVDRAIKNAVSLGKTNENGNVMIYVNDIDTYIVLSKNSLAHGLDRRLEISAPAILNIGNILKNSIKINEMNPKSQSANSSYILLGYAESKNNAYPVRMVVNRYTNEVDSIDVLYAINTKKETAGTKPGSHGKATLPTVSTISIADLLQNVKDVKFVASVLSKDVCEKLGVERPKSVFSDDLKFSISDDFDGLVDEYGAIPEGMNAQRDIKVPKRTSENQFTSYAARSIMEKGSVDDATLEQIKGKIVSEALSHERWSDKEALDYAQKQLEDGEAEIIWNDVLSGKAVLDKNKIAVAEGLLEMYANAGKADKVLTLTAELCEVGTRAGQVVQAFSLLKNMGGVGRLYYLQKVTDSINRDIEKKFGKKAKRIKIEESLATRMINAKSDTEVQDASEDIMKALGEQMPQTFLDKWNAWRYLSMLGNPRTHIRNIVGNAIFVPAIKIKNGIATALEHTFIKDEGKRTKAIKVSKDVKEFAEKDFEEMKEFITSGGKYQDGSQVQDYVRVFKNRILEGARKFNFDMLEREDAVFLKLHYKNALGQFITARGLDINNLTEKQLWEAREYAVLEAQKATYRDASAVASAINRLSQQNKVANVVVEGILPFKKTPINILKRGVEYSPIGLLTTLSKGSFDLRNGKITASQYIDGISSGLTGTGIMALGVLLGSLGVAVGGMGDDEDKWFRQQNGEQEYSIVIGGHSYTVDWAAPSCIPFFIGVELQKVLSGENDNVATAFVNALDGALEPLTNLSMLQGINDTLDTIKWSDSPLTSIVSDSITSYFTQALPTLAGQMTRVADGTRYKNYVDKNSPVPEWLQQVANTVSSKTGNWGKNPYRNAWGETEVDDSLIGRIVSNLVSPGYYSKVNYDEVNEEIARLYNAKGNKLVLPDTVDNKISVNGEYKHLSADEYEEYQIAVGQSAYEYIDQVINSDFYKNADDNTRVDMIADIYSYCENVGKTTVSDYELSSSDLKVKLYLDRGVTMADYLESEYSEHVETEEISTDVDAVNELLDDIEENYSGAIEKMSMVDMAVNFIRDKQKKSLSKKDAFIDTASSSGYDIGGMFVANADYESTDKKADKIDAIRKSDADEGEKFLSMAYVYLDGRKVTYKGKYDSFSKLSPSDKLRYISAHESEIRAGINSDY